MSLLKAMFAGAIGAAIGAAIWLGGETMASRSLPWLALLVGLLAGLGVRCCCPKEHRSFVTGAIAAIMTLLGVVVGPLAHQVLLQYNFDRQEIPAVRDIDLDDEAEADEDDSEGKGQTEAEAGEIEEPAGEAAESAEAATAADEDQSSSRSIIAAARPYLAQATADGEQGRSAIKEFFDEYLDLICYAGSAILAYILGSGGTKKEATAEPATDGSAA